MTDIAFQVIEGLNDTAENFLSAVERNDTEIAPSSLYALACIQEGVPFINGSPQNTFVPGLIDLAVSNNVLIGGDDFKSGQTKMKSVLVDFLVGAGMVRPMRLVCISISQNSCFSEHCVNACVQA